jgi:transcriptional regulator with XRE-family HTH domain
LAERAGVSVRTISDIERGVVRRARRNSLDAIAHALGLSEQDRAALFTHHRGGAAPQPIVPERADPEQPVPCQLPPDTALFTGRHAYLRQLDAWLRSARGGARIVIVDGPAGVGKTTLQYFRGGILGEFRAWPARMRPRAV